MSARRRFRRDRVSLPFYRWCLTAARPIPGYPRELRHLGDHLLKRRLDLELEQQETAKRLGVHPGGLANWEYGRTLPAARFHPAIIGFLGYDPWPEPETGAEVIQRQREKRGWSRKRLAAEAGVDEATVRRIESAVPGLARRSFNRVLQVLGLRIDGGSVSL